jgi:hypothetical protein
VALGLKEADIMSNDIKHIDFIDLSAEAKIEIRSWPSSEDKNSELKPGNQVLVQTQRAKELNFYIVLEITELKEGTFIGKVIGQEGYEGPRDNIYPGEYLKFEFDGLTTNDFVRFERKHIR